jgi:hypothetical protein
MMDERMADKPRAKAVKGKRRRHALREEFLQYIVAIDGWDWSYSLSLNEEKHPVDPYHEYRHLLITGRLLRPTGLKTEKVEVNLLPSVEMSHGQRKDHEPLALGSLDTYNNRIVALISIPPDVLPPILQMLIDERFKFVLMSGTKFHYRRARLHGFRLEMNLTVDDMPLADAHRA